jgi:leader peptidase (prepilin peptidase)/N-methyltransferase
MHVFWYIFFVVLGLVIASFLNVCIDRLPRNQSIVNPPSHCDSCQRRLAAKDLIPTYSYLRTKGKCSYCGAPIPRRVLWVEIGTGAYFGFLFWRFGLSPELGIIAFYSCIFIVLMVIDFEHGLILNKIVYPAMAIAFLISAFAPGTGIVPFLSTGITGSILSSIIAGATGFIIFLLIVIISRGGMGFGDVKMVGLIGLIIGWPKVFVAILVGILLGGLVAILLLFLKIKGRKHSIPFGPFLAIGAMATLLYGQVILDWYLKIIGLN